MSSFRTDTSPADGDHVIILFRRLFLTATAAAAAAATPNRYPPSPHLPPPPAPVHQRGAPAREGNASTIPPSLHNNHSRVDPTPSLHSNTSSHPAPIPYTPPPPPPKLQKVDGEAFKACSDVVRMMAGVACDRCMTCRCAHFFQFLSSPQLFLQNAPNARASSWCTAPPPPSP